MFHTSRTALWILVITRIRFWRENLMILTVLAEPSRGWMLVIVTRIHSAVRLIPIPKTTNIPSQLLHTCDGIFVVFTITIILPPTAAHLWRYIRSLYYYYYYYYYFTSNCCTLVTVYSYSLLLLLLLLLLLYLILPPTAAHLWRYIRSL